MKKVRCKLLIDLETTFDDIVSDAQTVRYCVKQDLEDRGYNVRSVECAARDCTLEELVQGDDSAVLEDIKGALERIANALDRMI